jgi:hypothetical protein
MLANLQDRRYASTAVIEAIMARIPPGHLIRGDGMDSEDFRRARDFAAWTLLAAAAVQVFIGAWALSGLPGGPFPYHSGSIFAPTTSAPFWFRGETAISYLVGVSVTVLPVAAALLAALAGRPSAALNPITLTAVTIQAVALALGLVAWIATLGNFTRWSLISTATDLVVALAALLLTNAVQRSRPPRKTPAPTRPSKSR